MNGRDEQMFTLSQAIRIGNKPWLSCVTSLTKQDKDVVSTLREQFPMHTFVRLQQILSLLREADRHDVISYVPGATSFNITNDNLNDAQSSFGHDCPFIKDGTGVQKALNSAVFNARTRGSVSWG